MSYNGCTIRRLEVIDFNLFSSKFSSYIDRFNCNILSEVDDLVSKYNQVFNFQVFTLQLNYVIQLLRTFSEFVMARFE